jgi:hypothetical protein
MSSQPETKIEIFGAEQYSQISELKGIGRGMRLFELQRVIKNILKQKGHSAFKDTFYWYFFKISAHIIC